jgi:carboxyl-terminal processing protease
MPQKKLQVWLPLLISLSMALGMLIGYKLRNNFPDDKFFDKDHVGLTDEVAFLITKKYMDKVSEDTLYENCIESLMTLLDPHSKYISPDEMEDTNNEIEGRFFGIGVEFDIFQDSVFITHLFENSPAMNAGLQTGDLILNAGNIPVTTKSIEPETVRELIRGDQGSKLTLTIIRNGKKMQIPVTRDAVSINSIEATYRINDTTGYIRLQQFSTKTYREFMLALQDLQKKPLKKLILDLRYNGGGVLDEAIEIADEFLDGDKLITYTVGKHQPRNEYRCRRKGQFETGKLVILCNDESASASEVLMGALQDWDRAVIIGNPSFGKGLIQEQFDLSNGGALRLSVARYYTPLGRSIQRSYANGSKAYYDYAFDRNRPTVSSALDKPFTTPKGKKLFDSNGITPDITMYRDSVPSDSALNDLAERKLIEQTGLQYHLKHKDELSRENPKEFIHSIRHKNFSMELLQANCLKQNVKLSNFNDEQQRYIQRMLNSFIADYQWGKNASYEVYNSKDKVYQAAVSE